MASQIPTQWKEKVRSILDSGNRKQIIVRQRATTDWSDLFPEHFSHDLFIALSDALSEAELVGRLVANMDEPGEVYEFIFTFSNRSVYSKINLCPDGTVIIIYSAHRPLRGETL